MVDALKILSQATSIHNTASQKTRPPEVADGHTKFQSFPQAEVKSMESLCIHAMYLVHIYISLHAAIHAVRIKCIIKYIEKPWKNRIIKIEVQISPFF